MANVDRQRLAELARSGTKLTLGHAPAPLLHPDQAMHGLKCADQYGTAGLADEVEAPVNAVDLVDIGVPRRTEHGGVARCRPLEAVRSRIGLVIGFHLD